MKNRMGSLAIGLLLLLIPPEIEAKSLGKELDTTFWLVSAGLVASTIYDIETTFQALENCATCKEGNFLVAPLVDAGRPAIYGVMMGLNAGLLYLSHRVKKQGSKIWWVGPAIATTAHTVAGTLNLRYLF